MKGLIGKKVGMTQVFDENGNAIPVTVIQAGPCYVTQSVLRIKMVTWVCNSVMVKPSRRA